jgi:hypothetical protein
MVINSESKPDEELSSLTFGRNTSDFTHILTHQVVHAAKQWVVASPALGVCDFPDHNVAKMPRK